MKKPILGLAVLAGLASCGGGGNPFDPVTVAAPPAATPTEAPAPAPVPAPASIVPASLSQDLQSFTYDPANQTLSITGVAADDGPLAGTYRRRPGLDRAGYEAYTAQDGSLDRHVTAYVRDIRGTRAAVIVTGVQFEEIFAGSAFSNTTFSAPVSPGTQQDGGLVTYAGTYVGLLNGTGSTEDLAPVAGMTDSSPLSGQSAEVTGNVVITGDFTDSAVSGVIFNRNVIDDQTVTPANIALDRTAIAANGTFQGVATQNDAGVGEYAGIFGGTGATEVAGTIRAANHIDGLQNVIENGAFVLSQCGQADEDPVCNQPVP